MRLSPPTPPCRMFVTDFDGTLHNGKTGISTVDLDALSAMRQNGITVVLATGRSLFSYDRIMTGLPPLPVDYLVFSTGAGILRTADRAILHTAHLEKEEIDRITRLLDRLKADYMVHAPIPQTHEFRFRSHGGANPDFDRRLALYEGHATPLLQDTSVEEATEILVVSPKEETEALHNALICTLPGCSVIRATSPLDDASGWIEIFAGSVSKSKSLARLAARLDIPKQQVVAIGNDYNDTDMLEWAGIGAVVENAPESLKSRFVVTPACGKGGIATLARPLVGKSLI